MRKGCWVVGLHRKCLPQPERRVREGFLEGAVSELREAG